MIPWYSKHILLNGEGAQKCIGIALLIIAFLVPWSCLLLFSMLIFTDFFCQNLFQHMHNHKLKSNIKCTSKKKYFDSFEGWIPPECSNCLPCIQTCLPFNQAMYSWFFLKNYLNLSNTGWSKLHVYIVHCTMGTEADKNKYTRLLSEYKQFKKNACQHFRFNSAANLTKFGKFQSKTVPYMKLQERSCQSRLCSWFRSTLIRQPSTTLRETRRSRPRPSWDSLEAPWAFSQDSL